MQNLQYHDFKNIKYKLIFDYYDRPLSFVAQIKMTNYLFFLISAHEYFIVEVDHEVANKLNEYKDLTKLFKDLEKKRKINVLFFKNNKMKIINLDEVPSVRKFVPEINDAITFDYKNEMPIYKDTNLLPYLTIK